MRSRMIIIVAGVLVLLTLGGILLLGNGKKKEEAVKLPEYRLQADTFMNLMTSNKAEQSYAMLSASMQGQNPYADWTSQLRDIYGGAKVTPIFVSAFPIDNKRGYENVQDPYTVSYELTIKGVKWKADILILRRDNIWQVDDLKGYKQ